MARGDGRLTHDVLPGEKGLQRIGVVGGAEICGFELEALRTASECLA